MTHAIEAAAEDTRVRGLPAWPLTATLVGFPFWWLFGASWAAWPVGALLMAMVMLRRGRIRLPAGTGLWLLFVSGNVVLLALIANFAGIAQWLYYMVSYLTATVMMVFVYNLEQGVGPAARRLAGFWVFIILCGLLGLFLPDVQFQAPLGRLLPPSLAGNGLVKQFTTIDFSSNSNFLGVPRPSAPFIYANRWGLGVLLCLPCAVHVFTRSKGFGRVAWTVLLALSVVPVIFSLNRGLWAGIGIYLGYMALRAAKRGNAKWMFASLIGAVVGAALVFATPLHDVISAKLGSDYSTNARFAVYDATWTAFSEAPILGHGTSGGAVGDSVNGISVGSQGHFWTLLYSGGLLTTVPFMLWLGLAFYRSRHGSNALALAFRLPVLVALPMTLIYAFVPDGMALLAICYGAAMAAGDRWAASREARVPSDDRLELDSGSRGTPLADRPPTRGVPVTGNS